VRIRRVRSGDDATRGSSVRYDRRIVNARVIVMAAVALGAALSVVAPVVPAAQESPAGQSPLTVIFPGSSRQLQTYAVAGHEMVSLQDLSSLLALTMTEDQMTGGLTVSYKGKNITLTTGWALASVQGRLISLPAPVTAQSSGLLVPVEFISRAVALIHDSKIDLRPESRLLIVGDLRMPRVVVRHEAGPPDRVTVQISPKQAYTVRQEGGRVVVGIEADAIDATFPRVTATGIVEEIRRGDGASLEIDTGPQFAAFKAAELPADDDAVLVAIDLSAKGPAATTAGGAPADPGAARPSPGGTTPEARPLPEMSGAEDVRTIVVDPGHGGDDTGAVGPGGSEEKAVTLAVARRLKAAIEARLGLRVLLTRDGDQTVRIDERASLANNNKADLFLSLHANASVRPTVAGAEVFALSLEEYGAEAQRLASAGAARLPVVGGGTRAIDMIPWEMAQALHIDRSNVWARFVVDALRERVPMSGRTLVRAPFRVLVGTNMPAVLVEMGFITNPEQEQRLGSDTFQNALVSALVQSVVQYREFLTSTRDRTAGDVAAAAAATDGAR
jgi:N-acetylmuramoyl-L-alanine amidase